MSIKLLKRIVLGDMIALYHLDDSRQLVSLSLLPQAMESKQAEHRQTLAGTPDIDNSANVFSFAPTELDSLIQLKLIGDNYPGSFAQGMSLRNSESTLLLQFKNQRIHGTANTIVIETICQHKRGLKATHRLTYNHNTTYVECDTTIENIGTTPLRLEMLSSFSLDGITPFAADDAPHRLFLHRFRSKWSAEGRHEAVSFESLHLERSWSGHAVANERFGQAGSMPVRKFFPFVAIEDRAVNVFWAAQLYCCGSWQLEAYRRHDNVTLSGGLADRELGHWIKSIGPGEQFTTPKAILTTAQGHFDQACQRLLSAQIPAVEAKPTVEHDLPIIFNEWCTSWGKPSHDYLLNLADKASQLPIRYLVIDAGWYANESGNWSESHGDWTPTPALFPEGLKATADAIRQRGLIPGIWFEFETVGPKAQALEQHQDLLLKRDGIIINSGGRCFWDFTKPQTIDYLTEKVIRLIQSCGFGYLKVDYNETIGIGVDHADSLGEGLRQHLEQVQLFFQKIQHEIPDLVIENCSSGGHRLEPSMTALTAMSSFSDAHESWEIPIIAANLHRLILLRQNQVWSVLRRADSQDRLVYLLAATFLGRMCLSGELAELTPEQFETVRHACELYQKTAAIIKEGYSRRIGPDVASYRHPQGYQAMLRCTNDNTAALAIIHVFSSPHPTELEIPLPHADFSIADKLIGPGLNVTITGTTLKLHVKNDFSAAVLHLTQ